MPELAEQQAEQEVLLLCGRGAHERAQQLRAGGGRSGSGHRGDPIEQRINFDQLEARGVRGRHVAQPGQRGAADLHPPLPRLAAEEGDHDRDFFGRDAGEEIRQVSDLLQPPGCAGDRARDLRHRPQMHQTIVANPNEGLARR